MIRSCSLKAKKLNGGVVFPKAGGKDGGDDNRCDEDGRGHEQL